VLALKSKASEGGSKAVPADEESLISYKRETFASNVTSRERLLSVFDPLPWHVSLSILDRLLGRFVGSFISPFCLGTSLPILF
jgi:hypothetical protein